MGGVVLVTGVAGPGVASVARAIADRGPAAGIERVVGVDTTVPVDDLGQVKFVRADIRTPVIAKVMAVEDVDTVVHLAVTSPRGRSGSKELNVIGTMQVLAACQRNTSLRKLVLGSHVAVYGTSSRDPAVFRESATARGGVKQGFPKDIVEVESYTRGFARRRPDTVVTTLRFAHIITSAFETELGRFFDNSLIPSALGFDPRLQFLHPDDAREVVIKATIEDHRGTFNVAGDGVVPLSQAARILGKPQIFLPPIGFRSFLRRTVRAMGSDVSPDLYRLLTYGRAVDTSALKQTFGYTPRHTSLEAFTDYARSVRPGILRLGGISR